MAEMWDTLAKTRGYANEKEMWEGLYVNKIMSIRQLSQLLNFGSATIARRLELCGIKKKGRGGPNHLKKGDSSGNQIRSDSANSGVGEVREPLQDSPSVGAALDRQGLHGLLREDEGEGG